VVPLLVFITLTTFMNFSPYREEVDAGGGDLYGLDVLGFLEFRSFII
jgi:hypothetical protein